MTPLQRAYCVIVTVMLTMSSGCGLSGQANVSAERKRMPQLTLTEKDQGRSITVKAGDTISVTLNENPTTGFRWELDTYDTDIIALRDSSFIPPTISAPGAGGEHVFMFEGKKPGTAQVALELRRGWQRNDAVIQRYAINVNVAD